MERYYEAIDLLKGMISSSVFQPGRDRRSGFPASRMAKGRTKGVPQRQQPVDHRPGFRFR